MAFAENANAPELVIKPPQPLLDLIYNPRDPHLIIGGMMNGQVSKELSPIWLDLYGKSVSYMLVGRLVGYTKRWGAGWSLSAPCGTSGHSTKRALYQFQNWS